MRGWIRRGTVAVVTAAALLGVSVPRTQMSPVATVRCDICEELNERYNKAQDSYNRYYLDCMRGDVDACDLADEKLREMGNIGNSLYWNGCE